MVSDTAWRRLVSRLRSWLNGRSAGGSARCRLRALGWIIWINWIARSLRVCPRRRAESTDRAVWTKEHAPGALIGFVGIHSARCKARKCVAVLPTFAARRTWTTASRSAWFDNRGRRRKVTTGRFAKCANHLIVRHANAHAIPIHLIFRCLATGKRCCTDDRSAHDYCARHPHQRANLASAAVQSSASGATATPDPTARRIQRSGVTRPMEQIRLVSVAKSLPCMCERIW